MEEENLNEIFNGSNDLSCVETNLWLGNLAAATNINLLKEKNVKYVLTINSFPLPKNIINLNFIQQKFIKVSDNPQDDLLSHFDETYDFIDNGLKEGVVLVHCYHGISRSATVIISYLMKKKKMMLKEALEYVKAKRESIEPNPGFLEQLKLYEIMKCTLDKTNTQYKMYKLDMTLHHVGETNAVSKYFADVIQDDPSMMPEDADPTTYRCRKCRRVLAHGVNEIPHSANGKYNWRDSRWSEQSEERDICHLTYFIEPLDWMENVRVCLEGKILCPNKSCRSKLGSFNWVSGVQCPCGTKVRPGFYLIPSKVDKQRKLNADCLIKRKHCNGLSTCSLVSGE